MKLTKEQQQYVFLGVMFFLGGIYAFYQYVWKDMNNKIIGLQKEVSDKEATLKTSQQSGDISQLQSEAATLQSQVDQIQSRLPLTVEKIKVTESVYLIQSQSGVVLTSFLFQQPQTLTSYIEVPAAIRFNSDFKGLLTFLYQIGIASPAMTVQDLMITPLINTAGDHPTFTLQAQMLVNGIQALPPVAGVKQ